MSARARSLKNEIDRLNIFLKHDRKMAGLLLKKDFYKVMSSFSPVFTKKFERHMESYVKRLDEPRISRIGGVKFFHRLRDLESLREIFELRDYGLMKDFLPKQGDYVLDAGAGIGEYSLIASSMVGRNGKVLSIEASSEPFHYLRKNAKNNRNIMATRSAVSHKNGKIKIFRPRGTSFIDSVFKNWSGPTTSYSVKSVTVDNLVKKFKMRKLDLLKLDIEGAELLALRGALGTLKELRPKIIIETHGRGTHNGVKNFLKRHGYKIDLEKVKFRDPFLALVYASPKARRT